MIQWIWKKSHGSFPYPADIRVSTHQLILSIHSQNEKFSKNKSSFPLNLVFFVRFLFLSFFLSILFSLGFVIARRKLCTLTIPIKFYFSSFQLCSIYKSYVVVWIFSLSLCISFLFDTHSYTTFIAIWEIIDTPSLPALSSSLPPENKWMNGWNKKKITKEKSETKIICCY